MRDPTPVALVSPRLGCDLNVQIFSFQSALHGMHARYSFEKRSRYPEVRSCDAMTKRSISSDAPLAQPVLAGQGFSIVGFGASAGGLEAF
jgi:hypothetical protein